MDESFEVSGDRDDEFMRCLTGSQSRLYAYICTLLGDTTGAHDVLQEANLVLWRKAREYDPSRPFLPWAYRIAHLQVLAFRKTRNRSRLVFDERLLTLLGEEAQVVDERHELRLAALAGCLERLDSQRRGLVDRRYSQGESLALIADDLHRSPNVVAASLYRIRKALLECIESRLAAE